MVNVAGDGNCLIYSLLVLIDTIVYGQHDVGMECKSGTGYGKGLHNITRNMDLRSMLWNLCNTDPEMKMLGDGEENSYEPGMQENPKDITKNTGYCGRLALKLAAVLLSCNIVVISDAARTSPELYTPEAVCPRSEKQRTKWEEDADGVQVEVPLPRSATMAGITRVFTDLGQLVSAR